MSKLKIQVNWQAIVNAIVQAIVAFQPVENLDSETVALFVLPTHSTAVAACK